MKKKHKDLLSRRRTIPERLFFALEFAILAIWSFIMLYMLFWAITSALKSNLDYVNMPLALPDKLHFENFLIAIKKLNHNDVGFWGMLWNSIWLVLGSTLLSTLMVCITGYIFAQYDFKGRNLIFNIVIFTMIIPIYGSFTAQYKLIHQLGLNDSYLYLITSLGGLGGNMLLTYGYFKSLPKTFREAVYMDGGNDFTAFFKVYLPLGRNVFTALALLGFINGWNNYETPIVYFDKMPTLASGLYYFQQEIQYEANNPAYFAGALMVMLPVIIVFIVASDKIMGQLYSGGIKG